jgi:hypothetical protein
VSRTLDLIRQHAGRLSAKQIGDLAGVTEMTVRNVASQNDIKLEVPRYPPKDKDYYAVFIPKGMEARVAGWMSDIMVEFELTSMSDAWVKAMEIAGGQLDG